MELKMYPDPCLKIKAKIVESFDDDLKKTLKFKLNDLIKICIMPLASTLLMVGAIASLMAIVNNVNKWNLILIATAGISTYIITLGILDRLFGQAYYNTIKEQFNALKPKN